MCERRQPVRFATPALRKHKHGPPQVDELNIKMGSVTRVNSKTGYYFNAECHRGEVNRVSQHSIIYTKASHVHLTAKQNLPACLLDLLLMYVFQSPPLFPWQPEFDIFSEASYDLRLQVTVQIEKARVPSGTYRFSKHTDAVTPAVPVVEDPK